MQFSQTLLKISALILLFFSLVIISNAQVYQGYLAGTIKDANGAIVTGATVTVTNDTSGFQRTVTTNDSGSYLFTNLNVGEYTVLVKANGFADNTSKNVKISVATTNNLDITLSPSGVSGVVSVSTSDVDLSVNTNDQQLSTLINNKKILDLPLLSRDPNGLVLLAPGTVASNSALGGVVVNGQRERNNNFIVDGTDNNDTDVPGILGGASTPNIDATEEFRVITNNFSAEFGRNSGGIITVAKKSGTNQFHGGGYIYYRSDAFAARNFFDTSGEANPLQRRQYGGTIGGPIIKDKTFFFFNAERDIFDQGITVTTSVPTANARRGIFNLPTGTIDARAGSANNIYGLPVNPNMTAFLNKIYPLGNVPGESSLAGVFDLYRFGTQTNDRNTSYTGKIDHRLSDKHTLIGSFDYNKGNYEFCCETLPGLNDAIRSPQKGKRFSVNFSSIFTPTLTNEFKFGYNRLLADFNGQGDGGVSTAIPDAISAAIKASGGALATNTFGGTNGSLIDFNSTPFGADLTVFDTQSRKTGTISTADNLTWIKGNHVTKFGYENRWVYSYKSNNFFRHESLNFDYPTSFGDPLLSGLTGNALAGSNATVQNFASFLYGLVAFQTQSQFFDKAGKRTQDDFRQYRQNEVDFYGQDTWKIRPNLTLNLGIRYEYKGVPYEKNGLLSTLVDQDGSGKMPTGGFAFKTIGKNSDNPNLSLYQNDWNNFAPRVGFAYSPNSDNKFLKGLFGGANQSSIRGGFGIFYDRVFGNLFSNASGNPPFLISVFEIWADTLDNVTRPTTQTVTNKAINGDEIAPVIFALPGNNKFQSKFATPYRQGWNFGMQRNFGDSILFEADYAGSRSNNLLRVVDGNMTSVTRANAVNGTNTAINPFSLRTNYLNGSLNTAFNTVSLNLSTGYSIYHAGTFRLTKRLKEGSRFGSGEFQGSYTWSHSIDDAGDPLVTQAGERSLPRDSSGYAGGLRAERGNSSFDVRNAFVGNMVYEFPFKFENKFLKTAFSNWTLSGIWTVTSGRAYSVFSNTDSQGTGLSARADYVGAGKGLTPSTLAPNPRVQTGPTRDMFNNPLPVGGIGRQGTTGRGAFYGPGYNQVDFSVIKRFTFGPDGRFKFTARSDFFNIFNTVNFGQPVNTINSSNFGRSTATYNPRIIQFAGRFDF